jgi:hypothetical protein
LDAQLGGNVARKTKGGKPLFDVWMREESDNIQVGNFLFFLDLS